MACKRPLVRLFMPSAALAFELGLSRRSGLSSAWWTASLAALMLRTLALLCSSLAAGLLLPPD